MQTTAERVLSYLQSYDLKPNGSPNAWRCNSPLRPGSNSHSFTLKIEGDGEKGVWDDHAGGEGGTLYQLADRLGIEKNSAKKERVPVENSKRTYKTLNEYAALKGVPTDAFVKAGWKPDVVTYDKRPALTFITASGTRYRFLDGKVPAFKSQKGYKACWYGLKVAVGLAKQQDAPLVLCNGEPSTVVGLHFKVPACAITGGEQPTIPAPLLDELKSMWQGTIMIAMDCDLAGRTAAAGKAKILKAAGFTVQVIDLGLGEKGDLADFCKLHTTDSLAALQKLVVETPADAGAAAASPELAALLRELAAARRSNDPNAKETLPALLDKIQTEIDLSRLNTTPQAVQSFAALVDIRHKRLDVARQNPSTVQGLRSNLEKLDNLIGGFVPGRVYAFYGDTGMGKSTMAATIAANFAGQAPGFIIPTESMPGDYLDKLVAYKANVPFDAIETGSISDEQYRNIMAVYGWLEERNCHFLDSLAPTATAIGSAIRSGISTYGYQWALIDSINNLTSLLHDDLYGRTSEAADFAQELARMGLVVIITSQVGRNLKDRKNKMPTLNDALGSGRIEQNADVVATLYNHQYYVDQELAKPNDKFPPGMILTRCLKHRWRGSQVNRGAQLVFKGGIGIFN